MATNPNTLPENAGRITAPDANYPYGSAKDDSTGTTGDGTPIKEAILNDTYGLQQALLVASGLVPTGNADTAIASQYLQAVVQQAMGRATLYDETGIADAYIAENRTNQQGPGLAFEGMVFSLTPGNTNTGASTFDISNLLGEMPGTTVIDIKMPGGVSDPAAGYIVSGSEPSFIYRTSPGVHAEIRQQPFDYLNTPRISVASAATVDLTANAPDTRHINITGTTTITGFTAAIGQCYFVRFDGALTLTNSASLVTQSGADIITAAGDTCLIRATAANVVEVLCYTPGIPQELGYRQTWQDLTGSRALGVTYTNTTGRAIAISVVQTTNSGTETGMSITVDGEEIYSDSARDATFNHTLTGYALIPAGATYIVALVGAGTMNITKWSELR